MEKLELTGGVPAWAALAVLAAVVVAAGVCGAWLAARGRSGELKFAAAALYALAAGALGVALAGPEATAVSREPVRPRLVALVDRSASMREKDCPDGAERWRLAAALLGAKSPTRTEIERSVRLTLLAFDDRPRALADEDLSALPAGPATDIAAALRAAAATPAPGQLAGIVLIGDGRVTAGAPPTLAAGELSARHVPVWTVGAGAPSGDAARLRVSGFDPPETATLGEEISVGATVEASGLAGRPVEARLLFDGREAGRLDLRPAGASERMALRLPLTAKPQGVHRLEILASAGPGVSARAERHIVVLDRPLRALYAEGRLGWGYREMCAALSAAAGAELDLAPAFVGSSATVPDFAARVGRSDVVVLGDLAPAELGERGAAALARAVREDGCGLLFMGSPERALSWRGTPLEPLLPVSLDYVALAEATPRKVELSAGDPRPAPLQLDPTPAADHRLWSTLPETRGTWKAGRVRPGAEAWLRAGGEPVLITWKAGAGRAAVLVWPDHWRWARASADGEAAHRRLFARLAVWLSGREEGGGRGLALAMSRYRLAPGEEAALVARVAGREVPPQSMTMTARLLRGSPSSPSEAAGGLRRTGGEKREEAGNLRLWPAGPGAFRAAVKAGEAGEYRVEVRATGLDGSEWARAETCFSVESRDVESENPASDFDSLREISRVTGGAFLSAGEAGRLPELVRRALPATVARERRARQALWDRPWLLAVALGALCAAWVMLRPAAARDKNPGT